MDDVIVGRDVRLSYWQGTLEGPEQTARGTWGMFEDHPAPDDGDAAWPDPAAIAADHAVIAMHRRTGRSLGSLTAKAHVTGLETFIHLGTGGVRSAEQGPALLRRMLALLLLRLAGLERLPAAIVLNGWDGDLCETVRDLAAKCPGAVIYPGPDGAVVTLRSASLAHRAARALRLPRVGSTTGALLVLDLREVAEDALVEQARRLHRQRLSRRGVPPAVMPVLLPRVLPLTFAVLNGGERSGPAGRLK